MSPLPVLRRFQTQEASTSGQTLKDWGTKKRTTCQDFADGHPGLYESQQRGAEKERMTAKPPAAIKKPSMYSDSNLEERLQTYGMPPALHYTIGMNAVEEARRPVEHSLETTNQEFFEKKPADATTSSPGFYKVDKTHANRSQLARDTWTRRGQEPNMPEMQQSLGGKGARGEITRRPGEGGNVYGVSVFVDEYAKWQNSLSGVPLGETVANKQTKYF
jgi:hypothetical protein